MKQIIYSPIDEFEIHPIYFNNCLGLKLINFVPINLMFFSFFFLFLFFGNICLKSFKIGPRSGIQLFFGELYLFVNRIVLQNYKLNGQFVLFFPFFLFLFIFILFTNLFGLVPNGFTNTAFIVHNFLITANIILGVTLMGFFTLGFKTYINFFVIQGLATIAKIFLFVLEVISHTAKAFSLSIRLFANMTAGHTLMHILAGGVLNILKIPYMGIFGFIPLFIFILVCLMELGISILQAYVFIVLVVLYFNESVQTNQFQNVKLLFKYDIYENLKFFRYLKDLRYDVTLGLRGNYKSNAKLRKSISKLRIKYKVENKIEKKHKKKMNRYAWGQKSYIYL